MLLVALLWLLFWCGPLPANLASLSRPFGIHILTLLLTKTQSFKIPTSTFPKQRQSNGGLSADLTGDLAATFTNQEIEPYFQPQNSRSTGHITGREALDC